MGMITKLSTWSLRGYQGFTIDKSMIKKLFNRKSKERNNFTLLGDYDDVDGSSRSAKSARLNEKQLKIKETISHRHTFRYTVWDAFKANYSPKFHYCFCCCICKGKYKLKKVDKI